MQLPRLGISLCLLGTPVAYDGEHRRVDSLLSFLYGKVEFVPVCPEVELGLGVPREKIQLVREEGLVQLRSIETRRNLTAQFLAFAEARIAALPPLSGYLFKKNSPSCGPKNVKLFDAEGNLLSEQTQGLFARVLQERFPTLPVIDEVEAQEPECFAQFWTAMQRYQPT